MAINCLQNKITNNLPNSLSCKAVTINGVNGSLNFTETKKGYDIQSLPNETFSVGDYVVYKTSTFLVTKAKADNEVYTSGSMEECTYILKFQSPTGTIFSYPCITSTKSFNQDETKVITLPSNQKSILCCFDEYTSLIKTGDRFYVDRLNNTTWHVIGAVDNTSFSYGSKGLIYFVVEQDLEHVNTEYPDRPDLGICNYKETTVTPEPPVGSNYAIVTTNGDLIIGNSDYITLTPTFYNADDTLSNNNTAIWTYDYPIGYLNSFTIIPDGNKVKIKVTEVFELLGKSLVCHVSDSVFGGFEGEIELIIASGW